MKLGKHALSGISDRQIPFVVFGFFLLFYSFTITRNLGVAHDAMSYLVNIERGTDLDHPHHLLYHWTARIWLLMFRYCQIPLSSAVIVQSLNILFGALTMTLFFRILRKHVVATPGMAFLGTLLPAFSFGFWFYATTIEVYIIPLFLLLATTVLLSTSTGNKYRWYWIGALHGLAMLYHQVNVLFGVVVLFSIVKTSRQDSESVGSAIRKYLMVVLPLTILPYLATFLFIRHFTSFEQCWRWTTAYAQDTRYWNGIDWMFLAKIVKGIVNAFIGGHFLFALPYIDSLLPALNQRYFLADDTFLVRNLPHYQAVILLMLTAAFFIVVFTLIWQSRKSKTESLSQKSKNLTGVLFVWLAVYSLFFCFWDAGNVEFWIPQSLTLWLLLLIRVNRTLQFPTQEKGKVKLLVSLAVLLLTVNGLGSIRWLADEKNEYNLAKTLPVARMTNPGDLIVTNYRWIVSDYFDYYSKAEVLALADIFEKYDNPSFVLDSMQYQIDTALRNGKKVIVTQDAVVIDRFTEAFYGKGVHEIESVWDPYRNRWKRHIFTLDTAYLISGD